MNDCIDAVAKPLDKVIDQLNSKKLKYIIKLAQPKMGSRTILDEKRVYVIRQQIDADGVYILVAAANAL